MGGRIFCRVKTNICVNPLLSLRKKKKNVEIVSVTSGCGGVPGSGAGSSGSGCYTGMVEPKPICKECGRIYSSISNLKQHLANVHSTSPQWEPCPICGKHFKTRQYLFNHLLQTHGIRQRGNRMPMMPPFPGGGGGGGGGGGPPPAPPGSSSSTSPSSMQAVAHHSSAAAQLSHSNLSIPHSLQMSVISTNQQQPTATATRHSVTPGPATVTAAATTVTATGFQPHTSPTAAAAAAATSAIGGPHSPMDPTTSSREVPHQATASVLHKDRDRDMASAMEQCLQYLASVSK